MSDRTWTVTYGENDGYDFMYPAFSIVEGDRVIATVDLQNYDWPACAQLTDSAHLASKHEEARQNANILAAAPDLLAAAKTMLARTKRPTADALPSIGEINDLATAIAKAEGTP